MDHTVLPAITPMPAFTSLAFTKWRLPRLRLRISNRSLLLIYLPRKNERLSRPGWLTYSGRFTHISGHPSAAGRAQDRESSSVKNRHSTNCATQPVSCIITYTAYLNIWTKKISKGSEMQLHRFSHSFSISNSNPDQCP